MGPAQSKKETEQEQTDHERLGHVKLQQKPFDAKSQEEEENSYLMHISRTVQSEKMYNEWLKSMSQIDDTESKEVILLPLKHSFNSVGMCGSSGIAKLTFDYYEFVLKTEIRNRYTMKKDFLETEVWYLLYNIVRAGAKFQHLKKKIGNIHPQNILINESGQIKIISTISLPGELNNYEMLLESLNEKKPANVFLAPEEINNDLIRKGNYPSHVDPSLAQVFSIGLTILSSGTLQDCDEIYNNLSSDLEIRKDKLSTFLKVFKEKYSEYLYQTVASMLALNPQDRKRCTVIAAALYEYEPQILDLEPFQPQNYRVQQRPSQGQGYQAPATQYQTQQPHQSQGQSISQQHPIYYQQPTNPHIVRGSYQVPSTVASTQGGFNSGFTYQQSVPIYHRSQM